MNQPNNRLTSDSFKPKIWKNDFMNQKEDAFLNFDDGISTKHTRLAYHWALKRFMVFAGFTSYDDTVKLPLDEINKKIKDFIRYLRNKPDEGIDYEKEKKSKPLNLATNTVKLNLCGVLFFFEMNDVLLNKKRLNKMAIPNDEDVKKKKEIKAGKLPYTTEEIKRLLGATKKLRTKALIHFFTSTGARPAVIYDPFLRMKHLEEMPHGCKSVHLYSDSNEAYYAFLTPEASIALEDYHNERKQNGEIFTAETPLFTVIIRPNKKTKEIIVKPMGFQSLKHPIKMAIKLAAIERKRINNKTDKGQFYGFRKRFNTILKSNNNVNRNIAEKLIGHKNGLDGVYLQPTKDQMFAEFYKAVPDLMIDQSSKNTIEIQELKEKNESLIEKTSRINELEKTVEKLRESMLSTMVRVG